MERITSRRNPLCVHIKKLGMDSGYREKSGEFLCDGLKLLSEAEHFGAEITSVLTSDHLPFPLPIDTKVYMTDNSLINSISPLKNAQKVLFTCKIPKSDTGRFASAAAILLDGVQDPGNVGTIIRTANAFGIKNIALTGSCADIYNPKTVRATMGAIFRQNICHLSINELRVLKDSDVKFIGAALNDDSKAVDEVNLKGAVIAIGSEGKGLSEDVLELCDEKVIIPISQDCESLNAAVAAAILIWSAK